MMKKLKEIKKQLKNFEYIDCPLCWESYKNSMTLYKTCRGLSDHKRICKKCWLIYKSPRRTEADNNRFYDEFYISHYMSHYKKFFNDWFGWQKSHFECWYIRKQEISLFSDEIKKAKKIIEIWCASGGVLKALSEINPNCYWIDIDYSSIEYAKKQWINVEYKSLFDVENNTYDFALMSHVVEHLLNPDIFLKKVNNILTEGWLLLIFVPDSYICCEWPEVPHTFCFSDQTLISMITKNGFTVKRNILSDKRPKYFKNDIIILFQKSPNAQWEKTHYTHRLYIRTNILKFKALLFTILIRILEITKTKELIKKIFIRNHKK